MINDIVPHVVHPELRSSCVTQLRFGQHRFKTSYGYNKLAEEVGLAVMMHSQVSFFFEKTILCADNEIKKNGV